MIAECKGEKIKYPLEELIKLYGKLKRLQPTQSHSIAGQSLEMSKVAFLYAKNQLSSMEKYYDDDQYTKFLFGLYPPHHDNCGYKSRMKDIEERLQELSKMYRENQILSESEQMKHVGNIMSLSVDCLRLYMYAEVNQQKQEEGESICQVLQH